MPELSEIPNQIYKPSKARQIISLIVAILVLIIGVLSTIVLFHQASQRYKIVYSDKPPTVDSKVAFGNLLFAPPFGSGGMRAYQVPHTSTETRNFYLGGFGSIVGMLILLFLIYKYSQITEIKNLPKPLTKGNNTMDTPIVPNPTPSSASAIPPSKPVKSKKFTIFVYTLLIVVAVGIAYIIYSIFVARAISRDAKRHADIMQLQAGLELYANDHQRYPENLKELEKPYKGNPYIRIIPIAPKPADGPCNNEQNNYVYKLITSTSYEITYCIGRGGQSRNIFTGQTTAINPGVQKVSDTYRSF